ncbi:heme d1 biosynthesis radical SAM protein NirJ [Plasticicumulans sp.]|uniref:heme d1 biosynthesis radical SAM protein NirJ n=1 Tax=Plasticicumulans sp. TaxID=2307179 RepID=UPI002C421DCB|nr:heme d1 biosynthesis radical SAM protein NirJ [Plasticicumulans sp.]HMV40583.1 heme d1 biosynthesis radical SAM protein NirJ [Plasticicumulans sp.]HNM43106.1 heme d1 biosynthesis radical SAM protein NirJ [Plasticicumulans sp.]
MFRISHYLHALRTPGAATGPVRRPPGPVVIWNLVRRCNLACRHCYSISADIDFPGELTTAEVLATLDDLQRFRVPALILSGGEPLLRPDIHEISAYAKALGLYLGLSTNGTLIDADNIGRIAATGFDYVGISLDGLRATHDRFRRLDGAFDRSLAGIRLCRTHGIKVGLRCTLTQDNHAQLPALLELMRTEQVDKFYLSHLNYAGRGARNRRDDAVHAMTRAAMDLLFETAWDDLDSGREYVSGNNDADGPYLLQWAQARGFDITQLEQRLVQWGGNRSGIDIANIDNTGEVHPDTFWWNHPLGNVREQPFSTIWSTTRDPLMLGLRSEPRPLKGRCAACRHLPICGGNTRVRAFQTSGDPWAEDPGCYLDDDEIGLPGGYAGEAAQPGPRAAPIRFDRRHQSAPATGPAVR